MKKFILFIAMVFFTISVLPAPTSTAQQQSGVRDTTTTQQRSSSSSSSTKATKSEQLTPKSTPAESAALKRSCQGLGRIKSKLQQIKGTLSEIGKIHNEFKSVNVKIKQESLTPVFEKRTISKQTSQDKSVKPEDFVPAEKRRAQVGVIRQVKKINGDTKRVRQKLTLQKANLEQEWKGIEGDLRQVSGSTSTPSPDRLCVSTEAKKVDNELATLQSQAESLKSQIDDLRSQLDQQYGQGSCAGRAAQDCSSSECENCCKWQNKITGPEGSLARSIQEAERNSCIIQCERASASCSFANFDQKANSLFNILSTVLKQMKEMQGGVIRNVL